MINYSLNILLMFFTFCIAGWVWECIYMSILEKRLLNRGLLNGPYIPIYGFGGCIVYFVLQPLNSPFLSMNSVKIFFIGLVSATLLEYVTSVVLEKLFHARWWDYTNYKFNLNGRICLIASLFWGVIAVTVVQVVNPLLMGMFEDWIYDVKLVAVTFMATLMLVDTCVTVCSLINLKNRVSALVEIENTKWEHMITKLEEMPSEYQQTVKAYMERAYKITNPVTKRLLSSFPEVELLNKSRQAIVDRLRKK